MNWIIFHAKSRQLNYHPHLRLRTTDAGIDPSAVALENRSKGYRDAEAASALRLAKLTEELKAKDIASGIGEKAAVELCNEVFRLHRNAEQMAREGKESKELRGVLRVRENLVRLLEQHGVQYFDLSGRDWDDRDNEFEPMGEPQELPGLKTKKIGKCERPLVKIAGRMVQRAKGVVQCPA